MNEKILICLFVIIGTLFSGCMTITNIQENSVVGSWTTDTSFGEGRLSTTIILNNDGTGKSYASVNNFITKETEFTYQLDNDYIMRLSEKYLTFTNFI